MRGIINRQDSYGNTALHYAKQYPDQSVVKFLLRNGAKIDVNQQKLVNISPRFVTLVTMAVFENFCPDSILDKSQPTNEYSQVSIKQASSLNYFEEIFHPACTN